ncbi:hypothetical protein NP493_15g08002 [Ridgeia piscesae]|uniref:Uncharacterized protein n=1 Tax=Ridgeia piscesae TaxID=27915 RepID=A0AAD9PF37_RIDPI|nr:hypothetical protein NP493_15g08002 [Ridgeia piscesae]
MATATDSMPPPSYAQVTGGVDTVVQHGGSGQEFPLSYVDFVPALITPRGFVKQPTYERFGDLVIKANSWLQAHPTIRIKTCESFEVMVNIQQVNTDVSIRLDYQHMQAYVRCLRIWIQSGTQAAEPQQIGYLNVVPGCKQSGGWLSMPTFDTFSETINKLNEMLSAQPLPGQILNLETQDLKMYSWTGSVDPDESYWVESGNTGKAFLNIIRLFYEGAPPAHEQIGCVDFVPACTQQASFTRPFAFEPFSAVVLRAQEWILQRTHLQVASVQSINYMIYSTWSSTVLDTQRTLFSELSESTTCYVRILRVCYVSGTSPTRQPITALACKTFVPCQLTQQGMFAQPTFETQSETMRRALVWLQATGAKVISAETVPLRRGPSLQFDPDATLHVKGTTIGQELLVLRIFLDGYYSEPPSEVLPPVPMIAPAVNDGCCTLL